MKQYDLGKYIGQYYTQLQYSASYMVFFSFLMMAGTFWAVAGTYVVSMFNWLSFPVFAGIWLVVIMIIIPWLDYQFMQKTRTRYLNEQAWKHDNPVKKRLDIIEKNQKLIMKRLGLRRKWNK